MSAEEPRPPEAQAPEPAPPPAAPPPAAPPPIAPPPTAPTTARAPVSGRLLVLIASVVIALALGGYFIARSGLLSGGTAEGQYTVEAYQPPQQLLSARERVLAYAQPDTSSPTVVMFGEGAVLDVNGRVSRGLGNEWYRIAWNGQTAFIRQQDTVAGEGAPPTIAERPKPEEEEEKPLEEEEAVDVAELPEAPAGEFGLADVIWVREPNARDFARFYPNRALDQGRSGRVVLDCVASARGALDCSVVEESPPGWGFGDAALGIARQARIAPEAEDGSSVAGRHVRMPLSFRAD